MSVKSKIDRLERQQATAASSPCQCGGFVLIDPARTNGTAPHGPVRCHACGRERLVVTIAEDESGRPWSSRAAHAAGGTDGYVPREKA